jgi:uncharacterized membrane protein
MLSQPHQNLMSLRKVTFLLAADILKSAISPTWTEIGQLAAIALIRTFLNYSLGHGLRRTPETNI